MAIPAANSTRCSARSSGFHPTLSPQAGRGRNDQALKAKTQRANNARCVCGSVLLSRYCLSAGAGLAGAAPVVMPGRVLDFGVTSRMPGGAAGLAGCGCAVWEGGVVPAWLMVVLFRP